MDDSSKVQAGEPMYGVASGFRVRPRAPLLQEATADPVFLFQRRVVLWMTEHLPSSWEWSEEHDCYIEEERDDANVGRGGRRVWCEITDAVAIARGYAFEVWDTVTVFMTREEGEKHGHDHAYNFPDGWRVYTINATGDLCDLLGKATEGGRYT